MRNAARQRRKLLFLTLRGSGAVREIEQIVPPPLWEVVVVHDLTQLAHKSESLAIQVVLVDLRDAMPFFLDRIPHLAAEHPGMQWVGLIENHVTHNPTYAAFLYSYFFDFCLEPVDPQRLSHSLGHAWGMAQLASTHLDHLEKASPSREDAQDLIGCSATMKSVRGQLKRYAGNDLPVLITGQTGTGKEVAARFLCRHSARAQGPFVAVNCGALSPSLVQSELFGHEKGAFTGAASRKIGRIEAAHGGTLLLDEVGDLPHDTQVNLLRFLQEGVIERVGGVDSIPVDVRVIAATHVDLERAVQNGSFREDLYFRLNVLRVHMPSLSERDQDVAELAEHYLNRFSGELRAGHKVFSPAALSAIVTHSWPGNIRELMNRLRRAIVLSNSYAITPADLELAAVNPVETCTLDAARDEAERRVILRTLIQTGRNVTEAAHVLGVSRVTLYRLIKKHSLISS